MMAGLLRSSDFWLKIDCLNLNLTTIRNYYFYFSESSDGPTLFIVVKKSKKNQHPSLTTKIRNKLNKLTDKAIYIVVGLWNLKNSYAFQ